MRTPSGSMTAAATSPDRPDSSDTWNADECRTSTATIGSAPAPSPLPAELTAYPMNSCGGLGHARARRYHSPTPRSRACLTPAWLAGSVTYDPPLRHRRTAAERADQFLSWQRDDKSFFAAGACHVLAWAFLRRDDRALGFSPVGLHRVGADYVNHVYVSNGTWAFDHDGWTREDELLAVTRAARWQANPGERIERVTISRDLERFCAEHSCRLPTQYAFDPFPRANAYLERVPVKLA